MVAALTQRHYWQCRLVTGGPPVGLVTWHGPPLVDGEELDRSPRWQCRMMDEPTGRAIFMGDEIPIDIDGLSIRNLEKIDEPAYRYLVDHGAWAKAHAPHHPSAQPRRKIDKRGASVF